MRWEGILRVVCLLIWTIGVATTILWNSVREALVLKKENSKIILELIDLNSMAILWSSVVLINACLQTIKLLEYAIPTTPLSVCHKNSILQYFSKHDQLDLLKTSNSFFLLQNMMKWIC